MDLILLFWFGKKVFTYMNFILRTDFSLIRHDRCQSLYKLFLCQYTYKMRQSHSWSRLLGFQSEKHRFESRNWSIFCLNINPFLKYFLHRGGLHRYSNFVYLRLNLSKIARKNFKNTGKYPEQWCKPLVQSDCITRSYYETGIQSQY